MIINVKSIQKGNLGEISVCPFQPFLCSPSHFGARHPRQSSVSFSSGFPFLQTFSLKYRNAQTCILPFFIMQWYQLNISMCVCLPVCLCLCLNVCVCVSLCLQCFHFGRSPGWPLVYYVTKDSLELLSLLSLPSSAGMTGMNPV